jgi:predicted protein tyrosine phosphatase
MSELDHKLRVLFICTQNKVRSLTAEHLYRVRPDFEVKSCGTANFAKNQLTPELVEWAEILFVFDETQMEALEQRFGLNSLRKPVVNLGLPDIFTYKSDALVVKLVAKLDPYLGRPTATKCPAHAARTLEKLMAGKKPEAETGTVVAKFLAAVGVRKKRPVEVK